MASSLPYAAPYSRTTAQSRPAERVNSQLALFLSAFLALVLIYTVVQLGLASIASQTLNESTNLSETIIADSIEKDTLLAQVEELKNPKSIETRARAKKYQPITNIEFLP
jgi:cell division protein FtsL